MNASGFPLKQQTASVLPARRHPVTVRRLAAHDSLVELTALLHDAFSRLKDMGLNCTCVDQSVDTARQRVGKGECYVAECNGNLVGTVTLCGPDTGSPSELYRQGDVASVRQLGIAPDIQGIGLGSAFLDLARSWARARDYRCVALETPKSARHLLDFYAARGVRAIEAIRFPGRCYVSAVMCKDLGSSDTAMTQSRSPGVHLSPLVGAGAAWTFAAIQGAIISLAKREEIGSTGLGQGVALPHARMANLAAPLAVYVRPDLPIDFGAPDGKPVTDILVVLVPTQAPEQHLHILAEAAQMFSDRRFREELRNCAGADQVYRLFADWPQSS